MAYNSKYTGREVEERLEKTDDIPYKLSELDNDMEFVTRQHADTKYSTAEEMKEISNDVEELSTQLADVVSKVDNIEKKELTWIEV